MPRAHAHIATTSQAVKVLDGVIIKLSVNCNRNVNF